MKKILFILLPTVWLATGCGTKPLPCNDRKDFDLKGNVQSVVIAGYEALDMDGEIVKDNPWYSLTVFFDQQGRIQEILQEGKEVYAYTSRSRTIRHYDFDGEFESQEVVTYTAQGDILSWTHSDASDTILSQEKYTYNSNGRCIEKEVYSPFGLNLICRDYAYDAEGHCTAYTAYNLDGTPSYGWQCVYDSIGRKTCEQWITPDGAVSGSSTFNYNEQGFVAVETTDNKYTTTYTYEYDEQGNWIVKHITYAGGYDRPSYAIEERTIVYYEPIK